ncbi:MAG: restriction endonuclease subunit S [Bacteroidales bacterium]|nr:restriction endonuclease subunit S [Bacteroidales bacterium]
MSKAEYKRLGDYIREVNVRNRELKVTNLLGLSIEKKFISSIANTIGTDMSTYKIVQPSQFAYVPVTSRNGEKITIALYENEDNAIISQAYTVFEIVPVETHGRASLQTNELLPEYLMMWFRRPEFDRYARFHSHGSAREVFDWDELCDVHLPIPSITRQREIVSEYETLSNRIRLNNQMIQHLEATAQALYRKTFVDNIDKENLPEGWRIGTLGEVVECYDSKRRPVAGYDRDKMDSSKKIYPYYGAAALMDYVDDYIFDGDYILLGEDGTVINEDNTPVVQYVRGKFWVNNHAHILKGKNGFDENLLYLMLSKADVHELVTGGVQAKINQENLMKIPVTIPQQGILESAKEHVASIFREIYIKQQENEKLTELQSLFLAKMGQ